MKILKLVKVAVLSLAVVIIPVAPVFGQDKAKQEGAQAAQQPTIPSSLSFSGAALGAGLGMGITVIGAGYGLGKIGAAALEGMARQPEVAARIQTAMLIIAAMLEGATLASVVLCFVVGLLKATF